MTDKTLVIGIGAQKGGTTWLHSFLSDHPECYMSSVKELHYFDAFGLKGMPDMNKRMGKQFDALAQARATGETELNGIELDEFERRLNKLVPLYAHDEPDLPAYLDYLVDGAGSAKVVGEVTPSYAMLSSDHFARMHRTAPKTRMIYVMRDPIARIWSQVRMRAKNLTPPDQTPLEYAIGQARLVLVGRMPGIGRRSDYAQTVQGLDSALPDDDVHLEFFEDIFEGGANRICDFLGISRVASPDRKPLNKGVDMPMPDDLGRDLLGHLKPQYDFVRARLGRLPPAWVTTMERYA